MQRKQDILWIIPTGLSVRTPWNVPCPAVPHVSPAAYTTTDIRIFASHLKNGTMNKSERERLRDLVREIDEADDKIDPLETLLHEVREMVKDKD